MQISLKINILFVSLFCCWIWSSTPYEQLYAQNKLKDGSTTATSNNDADKAFTGNNQSDAKSLFKAAESDLQNNQLEPCREKAYDALNKLSLENPVINKAYPYYNLIIESYKKEPELIEVDSLKGIIGKLERLNYDNEQQGQIRGLFLIIILSIGALYFIWNYRRQMISQKELQSLGIIAQKNQQIARMEGLIEGQEKEQERLARELHDALGAELGIAQQTFSRIDAYELQDQHQDTFENGVFLLNGLSQKLRNISHDLMPVTLKYGIINSLETYFQKMEAASDWEIDFEYADELPEQIQLSEEQKFNLYRIVQQCLKNVNDHANATQIKVQLAIKNEQFHLIIKDNGAGFNPNNVHTKKGIGLKTIESRTNKIKGTLEIDAAPNAGTCIRVSFPIWEA